MHDENDVFKRNLETVILDRFKEEQVVLIEGPRAVGKTTLLRSLADRLNGRIVDLDRPALRRDVRDDPEYFVAGEVPVLVDEYQRVPEILDAIKAELNVSGRPGRFILAGSSRHESLPRTAQALTGRLHRLPLYPLAQGEIRRSANTLLNQLIVDFEGLGRGRPSTTSRADYIEMLSAGGLPPAVKRVGPSARSRWFDDYVRLVLERDVEDLSRVQQAEALPRLLRRLAGQTGQVLNLAKMARACDLSPDMARGYLRLLESVFLVYRLPAWGRTLRSRVVGSPKLHLLDSGIAARLMRVSPARLATKDSAALSEMGHLLETFVVGELIKQASWLDGIAGFGHWRTHDGIEVDLVIELDNGCVIAFEVKAAGRVTDAALRPLRLLRDAVGDAFMGGVAFHLGEHSTTTKDGLRVMPVDRLWRS